MGLTNVGVMRQRYQKVEAAPSRFAGGGEAYTEWAKRADAWADKQADKPAHKKKNTKIVDKWFN